MATSNALNDEPVNGATPAIVDMKFEVIVIPVADVDRSKAFYTKMGWRLLNLRVSPQTRRAWSIHSEDIDLPDSGARQNQYEFSTRLRG
jgi:catechol 2,3-dioxygenase-like lactoylglutathione lyase family enzyme